MTTNDMIFKTISTKLAKTIYADRGGDNKKKIFDNTRIINSKDIKKINYVDFLSKEPYYPRKYNKEYNYYSGEYYNLRSLISDSKWYIKWYEREINNLQKKINELNDEIGRKRERLSERQNNLYLARKRVEELKTR